MHLAITTTTKTNQTQAANRVRVRVDKESEDDDSACESLLQCCQLKYLACFFGSLIPFSTIYRLFYLFPPYLAFYKFAFIFNALLFSI